jgi:hypothetical protein
MSRSGSNPIANLPAGFESSSLLYGSGILNLRECDLLALDRLDRQFLRRCVRGWRERSNGHGGSSWCPISNSALYGRCGLRSLSARIEQRRLRFIGHHFRKGVQTSLPLRSLIFSPPTSWRRPRGRPKMSIRSLVTKDITKRHPGITGWFSALSQLRRLSANRDAWRNFIDSAL